MPRHEIITMDDSAAVGWIEATNADVTHATFQILSDPYHTGAQITVTPDDTPPADDAPYLLICREDKAINESLADLFPGVVVPVRLWVRGWQISFLISHA